MSTRIETEWLYQEIRQMIRQEKGIEPAPELPSCSGVRRPMTLPPTYDFRELGPQAQMMARNCTNERLAMTLQCVAIDPMTP